MLLEQSIKEYGNRIGLFARATARTPNPQLAIVFFAFPYQFRKNTFFKYVQAFLLPKEVGLPNSKVASKYFDLAAGQGSGKEVTGSCFGVRHAEFRYGSGNCALEVTPALLRIIQTHLHRYQIT